MVCLKLSSTNFPWFILEYFVPDVKVLPERKRLDLANIDQLKGITKTFKCYLQTSCSRI